MSYMGYTLNTQRFFWRCKQSENDTGVSLIFAHVHGINQWYCPLRIYTQIQVQEFSRCRHVGSGCPLHYTRGGCTMRTRSGLPMRTMGLQAYRYTYYMDCPNALGQIGYRPRVEEGEIYTTEQAYTTAAWFSRSVYVHFSLSLVCRKTNVEGECWGG